MDPKENSELITCGRCKHWIPGPVPTCEINPGEWESYEFCDNGEKDEGD